MDEQVQYLRWDVTPFPKPRMTRRDVWLKPPRKPVLEYRKYSDAIKILSLRDKYFVGNPLSLIFVMPMPKSWSGKKCERMCGQPHMVKPDLDNLIKAFKDALCENDSFVHTYGCMKKVWGYEGAIIIMNNNEKDQQTQITV
jgi:Holliday junction resolvase RusA-like endonuclease